MGDNISLIGLFSESTDVAEAMDDLYEMGISENRITIMTGVPYPHGALSQHSEWLALPYIVAAGALGGFLFGMFLAVITPHLYRLDIGGHPTVGFPPTAIILFVFTMMATIVSTFLGVLWEMNFPRFGPAPYNPLVTNGYLALLLELSSAQEPDVRHILEAHHAEDIREPERMAL
jgi:hypothetical protein